MDMFFNIVPLELLQALAAAGIMFLVNNLLGMYNASQWFKYDPEQAKKGFQQTALLVGAIILMCGVTLVLPGELISDVNMIPIVIAGVEALVLARVGKAIAQISNIFNAKKLQAERDEDVIAAIEDEVLLPNEINIEAENVEVNEKEEVH